ncbi:MAG: 50S ribosomal protein L29 [Cyanothece sp. SIO2G6]|nr:50S ribosomal protein L29 [Cyanothece sp. SIO2G6]
MALPKIADARALSDEELQEAIVSTKRVLFDLRFQKATRQLEKMHEFKHEKHRLAQLMTVESERAIATAKREALAAETQQVDENQEISSPESGEGGEA